MAVYVDFDLEGSIDSQGNLSLLKDQEALNNAVKLWVCSFRGERLFRPNKGGFVVGALLKPMSEDRVNDLRQGIKYGLANDFIPSVSVEECIVTPDYENSRYYIKIKGYCPRFKSSVYTDLTLNNLV